jgi:hypothetical protein
LKNGEPFCDEEFRDRDMQVPDDMIPVVRETIADMYLSKKTVTLDLLMNKLQSLVVTRNLGWKWCRATLLFVNRG